MVGFPKKPLPGLYRFKMKEKTKGLDNYLWVEYGHNTNRTQSNFSLSLFCKQGGEQKGDGSAHPPNGVVEDEGKAKAFGLVEALLFTTSKIALGSGKLPRHEAFISLR
jgi:hypothetical protein